MPFDTDPITKAFLDLAKPLRGRETPWSQIVRELDDFNWRIHTVTPLLYCPSSIRNRLRRPGADPILLHFSQNSSTTIKIPDTASQ